MSDDVRLSPHFWLSAMLRSETALRQGIVNIAPPEAVNELRRWCAVLGEPMRELLGVPLYESSGHRCLALNTAVHGAGWQTNEPLSAHCFGRAVDVIPVGLSLQTAFEMVRQSALPYDQLIIECGAWLHVGMAKSGTAPRRMAETCWGTPGDWHYAPVA